MNKIYFFWIIMFLSSSSMQGIRVGSYSLKNAYGDLYNNRNVVLVFQDSSNFDVPPPKEANRPIRLASMISIFDGGRGRSYPEFVSKNLVDGLPRFLPINGNNLHLSHVQTLRIIEQEIKQRKFVGNFSGFSILYQQRALFMYRKGDIAGAIQFHDREHEWINPAGCAFTEKVCFGIFGGKNLPQGAEFILLATPSFWESFDASTYDKRKVLLSDISELVSSKNRNLDDVCTGLCKLARVHGMQKHISLSKDDISCAIMVFDQREYDPLLTGRENTHKEKKVEEKPSVNKSTEKVEKDLNKNNSLTKRLLPE